MHRTHFIATIHIETSQIQKLSHFFVFFFFFNSEKFANLFTFNQLAIFPDNEDQSLLLRA